ADHDQRFASYAGLHRWSTEAPAECWSSLWRFTEVVGEPGKVVLADSYKMPGARWFPDARLNFAENLLRDSSNDEALVFWGEDKVRRRLTRNQLRENVARLAAALRAASVTQGDRVAAYMPNLP